MKFTIAGPDLLAGQKPIVCFRWSDDKSSAWLLSPQVVLTDSASTNSATYTAVVPTELPTADASLWRRVTHSTRSGVATALGLVPLADFRVIGASSTSAPTLDISQQIGITNRGLAYAVTLAVVLIAWVALYVFGRTRQVPGRGDAILQVISTRNGYASLSQLQVILWSFVIGASTVYVMALSGNLVEISAGTLALLGISGVSTLGSKLQSNASDASATPPATPGPVVGLHADEPAGESDVRLTWTAPVARGQPDTYTVQYQPAGGSDDSWITATETRARPGFRVVGLQPNTSYVFRVFGTNAGGAGEAAELALKTEPQPDGAAGPVTGLRPTDKVTNTALALSWSAVPCAHGYRVECRRHDSDVAWRQVAYSGLGAQISGLEARTLYDVRVAVMGSVPGAASPQPGTWVTMTISTSGPRAPRWSDLVVESDGANEIDVTRVQMLFFTVIVAFFVTLRVVCKQHDSRSAQYLSPPYGHQQRALPYREIYTQIRSLISVSVIRTSASLAAHGKDIVYSNANKSRAFKHEPQEVRMKEPFLYEESEPISLSLSQVLDLCKMMIEQDAAREMVEQADAQGLRVLVPAETVNFTKRHIFQRHLHKTSGGLRNVVESALCKSVVREPDPNPYKGFQDGGTPDGGA